MLELFTSWIYCCSQLCAFWACEIYTYTERLCESSGMLANLQLCGRCNVILHVSSGSTGFKILVLLQS